MKMSPAIWTFRTLAQSIVHVKSHGIYAIGTGCPDSLCIGFDPAETELHRISCGVIAEALSDL